MATRTAVQCKSCGQPYSARVIENRFVLPTDDGKCGCGNDEFVPVRDGVQSRDGASG